MKIIGFVYDEGLMANGQRLMVLKGDSCLLNGRKPMFIPDGTNELCVTDCLILRVSRLGKEIALRFANRYYDAWTPGLDFVALDRLRKAQQTGRPWTSALAFDYSLAIGEWCEPSAFSIQPSDWIMSPDEAVMEASKLMTIRQGDLIYIQAKQPPRPVHRDEVITRQVNGEEKLYCKIK